MTKTEIELAQRRAGTIWLVWLTVLARVIRVRGYMPAMDAPFAKSFQTPAPTTWPWYSISFQKEESDAAEEA